MEQTFVALGAANPYKLKLLKKNDDGSILVEHPVLVVSTVDMSMSSSKGTGIWNITKETLLEIADNFKKWPWPVSVNINPHRPFSETHGAALGWIESLTVRGDVLWAVIKLTGFLATEVLSDRWRGFSGDFVKDPVLPTAKLNGWCMWAGVYTNKPASPVIFSKEQAASTSWIPERTTQIGLEISTDGTKLESGGTMDPAEKAALEAKELEYKNKIAALETENAKLKNDVVDANRRAQEKAALSTNFETEVRTRDEKIRSLEGSLAAEKTRYEALESANRTLTVNMENEKDNATKLKIANIIQAAMDSGVPAKIFEGASTDPVKWFKERFVSLESMELFINALPRTSEKKTSSTSSGTPKFGEDDVSSLSADERSAIESKVQLNLDFAGCSSFAEFKARREAIEKKTKK